MGYTAPSVPRTRKIFFQGNSLSSQNQNDPDGLLDQYVPRGVVTSIASTYVPVYYASSGQNQNTINNLMATRELLYTEKGDIVFLWEGTNNIQSSGLSGEVAFDRVVTYAVPIIARGCKLVIGTVIARNGATDDADLMDRIDVYNALVRSNAATYGYTVADLGADAMFDTEADCDNATNYQADKIHLVKPGQDNAIGIITRAIQGQL